MKLLFVDVEWNPDKDRRGSGELLEIGVVGTELGNGESVSYFSYIRPKRLQEVSKAQLEFLGIEESAISTAPDATTVLRKVIEDFSGYDLLVIWSMDAYQVLFEELKRCSLELKARRILILQDIIKLIVRHRSQNKPGFTEMLMNMGLDVKECGLHDAMNDAENLRRLYEFLLEKVEGYKINDHYFRKSAGSDVLHVRKCHHCRKIRHDNMESIGPVEILKGARLCLHCREKITIGKLVFERKSRQFSKAKEMFSEENIRDIARYMGFEVTIMSRMIIVSSGYSRWKIVHNNKEILEVFHENHKYVGRHKKFHSQAGLQGKKLINVLRYISKHDSRYLNGRREATQ